MFARDVTERKRAEEALEQSQQRLKQMFDNMSSAVAVYEAVDGGADFLIKEFNPAATRTTHVAEADAVGRKVTEVFPGVRDVGLFDVYQRVSRTGVAEHHPINFYEDDRLAIWVENYVFRLPSGELVVMFDDVSARMEAEAALRSSEEQLRQSQKMEAVGQLAGGIAHDFNNLLTAILGYSDLLLAGEDLAESPARKDIEEIRRAAERAAVLTGQILAFSRRQVLRPQAVSLNTVLDGMEVLLRRTIGEDIDLVISEDPRLALTEVDPHQFEQVLMNLVLNSRDAMPSGGRLTLETADVELDEKFCRAHLGTSPGSYVMLSVSDTGVGMDEATLAHIFEPFFTTKAAGAGTGLGLATVYGIVKQSNGSIFVTSQSGKGTSFKIYLPRAVDIPEPEEMIIPPHVALRGSETVMVVEDEEALRSLIERILSTAGYATLGFGSAGEALEALERGECAVDLLLTDVVLPGALQGYDLARAVLAARPDLPVLYVSGYTYDALVHAGQLDPGVNLLEKPFAPEALAATVRTVLDKARDSG